MDKKQYFLEIFKLAEKKYGASSKRLAGEKWKNEWQNLIATIYSAQSRDETTIPVMESFFQEFSTLQSLASAPLSKIMGLTKKVNYYKTKSKNSKMTAQILIEKFDGKIPGKIEELTTLPGVGRKTANLLLGEIYNQDAITVDTHVHRISNVLGLVKTKNPAETELALQKIAPRGYWRRINRIFVLWGKDAPGRDKQKLLKTLESQD